MWLFRQGPFFKLYFKLYLFLLKRNSRRFSYSTTISLPFIRNIKSHNLTQKNHKQKFFFIALSTDPCRNVNKQCICQISNQKMEFKQTKQNRSCNFYKNQICKILIFRNFIDCNDLLFKCIQK